MMLRTLLITIFLALTYCAGGALAVDAKASGNLEYCYQPCVVTLHGTIRMTWTYGPPNFGDPKTDKKIKIFVLVLDHKIDVHGSDLFDAMGGISEVQLYLPLGVPPIAEKQRVTVVGKLQQATTATDIYPIVMQVSAVKYNKGNKGGVAN
ncbi:hypothetical protein [Rhodanobacter sp. C05]|uniref:hypothetical protein n=1 Tax=Rhodanobacter sp. C05 TaxID=1945855 RepID=UPI0009C4C894|nr:hypothetical protein [Rhodanobacter sp. C05]OOG43516.1 hypothetical protein B0E51_01605 [Rhodanobacter sp. C05]